MLALVNFSIASTLGIRGWKKYKNLLSKIVTRRLLHLATLLAFCIGTGLLNKSFTNRFYSNEDQRDILC